MTNDLKKEIPNLLICGDYNVCHEEIDIHNPVDMPDVMKILEIEEPWIEATILVPDEYLGSILKLCEDRRSPEAANLCGLARHGRL